MEMEPLYELVSDLDDDELLQRVRAMVQQVPNGGLSTLGVLPSYILTLQRVLDRCEEKGAFLEDTLDELRGHLQSLRKSVKEGLEKARRDYDSLRKKLLEKGLDEKAAQAQEAIAKLTRMQETERVSTDELPALDDLYSTLLSQIAFDRNSR